jgi:hypothetical protein
VGGALIAAISKDVKLEISLRFEVGRVSAEDRAALAVDTDRWI